MNKSKYIFLASFYSKLEAIWPEHRSTDKSTSVRRLFLPVGSSMDVFFRGGPYPWFGQPLDHFIKGEFTYQSARYNGLKGTFYQA